jgi:hypothetical protein
MAREVAKRGWDEIAISTQFLNWLKGTAKKRLS